jgi:guanine nucleotide-binding protein G(i) subunit alpha
MAEAIAILGTIGAIANIVDATVKVASGLRELHNRWKDADFTLLNLIAQIIALKAALSKIEDWLSIDNDRQHHHQLVLDLDISLSCCKMLVDDMVAVVYQLNTDKYGALDMGSKIKVVLGDRKRSEYQKTIDIQISALTLVLSACTW